MNDKSDFLNELKRLYQLAVDFDSLKAWEWMYDSDLFGVENPENGEIGYCCVMGRLGEVFALNVYLGSEGLEGYLKMTSGQINPNNFELLHLQKCLMVSFEDRDYLTKRDLDTIKELGLKFRGKNAWPMFRNYQPGYEPWYINSDEVKYLILVLEQAIDICKKCKENDHLFKPPKKGLYFVRVPERDGQIISWRDEWLKPQTLPGKAKVSLAIDEIRVQRLKKYTKASKKVWEVDFFYSPFGIKEGERPYFPFILFLVDHDSHAIINFHLSQHSGHEQEFLDKFLDTIENIKLLPGSILVKREDVRDLLLPVSERLGIKILVKDSLASLEEAQESMMEFLSKDF